MVLADTVDVGDTMLPDDTTEPVDTEVAEVVKVVGDDDIADAVEVTATVEAMVTEDVVGAVQVVRGVDVYELLASTVSPSKLQDVVTTGLGDAVLVLVSANSTSHIFDEKQCSCHGTSQQDQTHHIYL